LTNLVHNCKFVMKLVCFQCVSTVAVIAGKK